MIIIDTCILKNTEEFARKKHPIISKRSIHNGASFKIKRFQMFGVAKNLMGIHIMRFSYYAIFSERMTNAPKLHYEIQSIMQI